MFFICKLQIICIGVILFYYCHFNMLVFLQSFCFGNLSEKDVLVVINVSRKVCETCKKFSQSCEGIIQILSLWPSSIYAYNNRNRYLRRGSDRRPGEDVGHGYDFYVFYFSLERTENGFVLNNKVPYWSISKPVTNQPNRIGGLELNQAQPYLKFLSHLFSANQKETNSIPTSIRLSLVRWVL